MYKTSWMVYAFLFYVMRYRRDVVLSNLQRSFPGMPQSDIRKIQKQFYKNFTAIFHEVIYFRKYTREELLERIHYTNAGMLTSLTARGQSIMVVAGHCGNWELLGLTLPLVTGCKTLAAAKKLTDSYFDRVINGLRCRMGLEIMQSRNIYRALLKEQERPLVTFLLADQSPLKHEADFWIPFLNQETAVYQGPEHIARAMGMAVIFAAMKRNAPGRYEVTFMMVSEDPSVNPLHEITVTHTRMLGDLIEKHPDSWLWSHKRWKHSKESVKS